MNENTEVSVSEKKKFTRRGVIKSAGLLGIAFASMPLLFACGTKEAVVGVGKGSKTLKLGISGDPAMLDPAKGQQEIANTISNHWESGKGQSSMLLRLIRHDLGIACEQSRFRKIYHSVKNTSSTAL